MKTDFTCKYCGEPIDPSPGTPVVLTIEACWHKVCAERNRDDIVKSCERDRIRTTQAEVIAEMRTADRDFADVGYARTARLPEWADRLEEAYGDD